MNSLRSRFVLSHLLPILLILPLMAGLLVYLLETQVLLAALSEDVAGKANLIAQTVNGRPELLQDIEEAQSFVSGLSIIVDENVFLIGPNGDLLASGPLATNGETTALDSAALAETAASGEQNIVITYSLAEQSALVLVPVKDINQQLLGIVAVTDTLAGAASQFGRLRLFVLGALALELLLGGVIGYVLARRLERPIERSASAVVQIAQGREIEPVPIEGPTEIQELSQAVNVLSERLRLLEEIRRRSLANIVHELARPLGAIRSATHVMRQGAGEDPAVREELLAGIEQAIENMQPLLDDLAQLHSQALAATRLNRRRVALEEWLPPLLLPWRAAARQKGLEWQADVPANLPPLDIDPERLGQALGNLLSNAVKYTPPGGAVRVTAAAGGGESRITVCDTGPGVQPEERARIFEPFYRSQHERRFPQGLGLGLTIARELVEAHGGRLELEGGPEGGSCFTIILPHAASPDLVPPGTPVRSTGSS